MAEELRFTQITSSTTITSGGAGTLYLFGLTPDGRVYQFSRGIGWEPILMTNLSPQAERPGERQV